MQAQNSLTHRGAVTMAVGAAIFLIYAIVFFFRAFSSTGFELGVATLNGVTQAQLNQLNPAITGYITHLHLATAGFIAATAIAVIGLTWYGVRAGAWWAWITAVISPVVGLVVAQDTSVRLNVVPMARGQIPAAELHTQTGVTPIVTADRVFEP